jgi:hypothetical protein
MQQYDFLQKRSLSSGERDSPSFYVHQRFCSKLELYHQEKGTRVAFCVQQH